ncbi:class I SAM-dependent methyltransferase [Chloroflexota bacterium]
MPTMREIFNQIASSWYNFRHWSIFRTELETLAIRWQKGRLINIGCAHGPDFLPFKQNFELHGLDFSTEMLKLAQRYSKKFQYSVNPVEADARHLPYATESFDWAIAVATYHHIDNKEDRIEALKELWRVLKPDGEAFITVWNRWQPKFWFQHKNLLIPWRTRNKTLHRYYYLFSYFELEKLAKKTGFEILKSFPERAYRLPIKLFSRNICLLLRKIETGKSYR